MQNKNAAEDERLIRAYQDGEVQAFEQLIRKYRDKIYRSLRFRGVPTTDAEDCTQEICEKLIEGLKAFRFDCDFETFLQTAIRNKAIDYYRKKRKRKIFSSLDDALLHDDKGDKTAADTLKQFVKKSLECNPDPDQILRDRELLEIVGQCLSRIKNQRLKILLCLWLRGLKIREMAALMQIKASTAGTTLARAKPLLRKCVEQKYL